MPGHPETTIFKPCHLPDRDIIYDFISQYHPPPQTTAIYGDFKKSTAISKGYNVGLRYIIKIPRHLVQLLAIRILIAIAVIKFIAV